MSSLWFLEHLNSRILFICTTHAHTHMDILAVWVVWYEAYKKFSMKLKHCLNSCYVEKGTQRVVSRQNMPLHFTSCFICLLPTLFMPYFPCSICSNAITYTCKTVLSISSAITTQHRIFRHLWFYMVNKVLFLL